MPDDGENGSVRMRILLVDDDPDIRVGFTTALGRRGHEVVTAASARDALVRAEEDRPDIGIIDVMLPDGDGQGLCRAIRDRWGFPTVMLTARDDDADIVDGLDSGADDYVVKPVAPAVLEARLRTVLRRDQRAISLAKDEPITIGDLTFDSAAMAARVGETAIALSATELRLLRELVDNRGRALTRDQLIDTVWARSAPDTPRVVDTTVQRLRAKLTAAGVRSPTLDTLRGIGYRLG